jgi:hypothetical protein
MNLEYFHLHRQLLDNIDLSQTRRNRESLNNRQAKKTDVHTEVEPGDEEQRY